MAYTVKSSLIKRSGHYTAQQLYAAFEPMIPADQRDRARRLIDRIVVLSKALNLDEVVVCAIVWIETGAAGSGLPFRSEWWRKGMNAGNLGITGDPAQNAAAQTWQTPEDAANGLMAHVVAYVYGKDWRTVWDRDELGNPQTWDKRFDHVLAVFGGAHLDTLEALNNRWAIDVDRAYDRKLAERANKLLSLMDDPPVDIPSTPEEPMASPETIKPQYTVAPVNKERDGQGFNYGTRGPIVGLVIHETQGRGTGPWYQQFFSCPNGERCSNALVDWLIDREGMLWEYQDPYNTNRIPWASGGPEKNTTIGAPINAKFRNVYGGVNKVYAAVEMVKTDAEALTPAQIQTAGKLLAYVMAKAGYPANDWRYPDTLGGNIYTAPHHSDISQTSCRIGDSDKAAIEAVCDRTLSAYYQGTSPGEEPAPEPPKPVEEIVPGVDWGIAKRAFDNPDNPALANYKLTKGGKLSELYIARVKQTKKLPKLMDRWVYDDGRIYYPFSNGDVAIFNDKDKSIAWIDEF